MNTLGTITYQQSHEIGEVMREQKEDLIRLGTNCVIIVFMLFLLKFRYFILCTASRKITVDYIV